MAEQSVKRKAKKEKWYLRDISSDIKYLGPLSYRHFKIFGWICLAVGQIGVMLSMVSGSGISVPAQFAPIQTITSAVGQLALVFFLIGNFSIILDDSDGYQRVLIVNGISTAAVIAAFFILYYRYILGVIEIFSGDRENAVQAVNQMLSTTHGFSAFNLFIDLFLCTLVMFFMNYKPKKWFHGSKIYLFRALVALPVLYEVISISLKFLSASHHITLPTECFPFLTTKPPTTFIVFLVLAIFIKTRERRFCAHGMTHEEYRRFQQTRRNSWHFSVFAAIVMAIGGLADFIFTSIAALIYLYMTSGLHGFDSQILSDAMQHATSIGFGKSVILLPMSPLMLLFSYTRTYKNRLIDLVIPAAGIFLIVLIYFEGLFQGIRMALGLLL